MVSCSVNPALKNPHYLRILLLQVSKQRIQNSLVDSASESARTVRIDVPILLIIEYWTSTAIRLIGTVTALRD